MAFPAGGWERGDEERRGAWEREMFLAGATAGFVRVAAPFRVWRKTKMLPRLR
ncbi:hypothetical protein [Iningainema tapete]|uniref:Uncharacterized protein n=1 Tax=Iningainema tapete BLCC-T55 TaxID=2748662 RepID=A0A8J6XQ50_9CYAN|nr:hypothetical protein [Iningainema tapete BLCC-T55]